MADSELALRRIDLFQRELDLQVQVKRNQDRLIDALCEIQGNVVESVSALNEIKGLREEVGHTKNIKERQRKEREKMLKDIAQHVEVMQERGLHCLLNPPVFPTSPSPSCKNIRLT
jgi:hypothetical protein